MTFLSEVEREWMEHQRSQLLAALRARRGKPVPTTELQDALMLVLTWLDAARAGTATWEAMAAADTAASAALMSETYRAEDEQGWRDSWYGDDQARWWNEYAAGTAAVESHPLYERRDELKAKWALLVK